ncbi:MbcA/ParS/Xre antitoxin family protein [Patescibacteria group bacterium]|nr:MbcA/ParS/Xre antitoxin family protein [Patescibacteria group bacterium]
MSVLTEKGLLQHVDRKLYNAKGIVDYHTLQRHFNVKVKTIASAIGRTPRALEKNPRSENIQKGLRKIVYVISLLKEMLESEAEILIWLKAPNPEFSGLSPWDVITQGEMEAVIDYLIDMRKGALT